MLRPTIARQVRTAQRMFSQTQRYSSSQTPNQSQSKVVTWFKSLPVEVYPLGVIVGIMSSFGIFSMVNALGGKNLRLSRSKRDNHEEVKPWK